MISGQNTLGPASTVESRVRKFFERYNWNLTLALVMSALKHGGFEEEREWRLVSQYPEEGLYGVSFRSGRFGVTPYFELPLAPGDGPRQVDEVVIGPTSNRTASLAALSLLLSKSETEVGHTKISHTPLRH
jgi:hypothetical protein